MKVKYLSNGEIYTVYSIFKSKDGYWHKGGLSYLIYTGHHSVYGADEFEVINPLLPPMWYFSLVGRFFKRQDYLTEIWGYKEMVFDEKHFYNLLDCDPETIEIFKKRKEEIDEYEALLRTK